MWLLGDLDKKCPKVAGRKQVERIGGIEGQADLLLVRDAGEKPREESRLCQGFGQKRQVQHHKPTATRLKHAAAKLLLLGGPQHRLRGKAGEGRVVFRTPALTCVGGVFQPREIDELGHAGSTGRSGHIYQQVLLARKTRARVGKAGDIHDRVE